MLPNGGLQKFSVSYVDDVTAMIEKSLNASKDETTYNIISQPEMSMAKIIECASWVLKRSPEILTIDGEQVKSKGLTEWEDMPLWIDSNHYTYSNKKILESLALDKIKFEETVKDTINYYDRCGWPQPTYGIDRSQQLDLLNTVGDYQKN